MRAIPVVIIGAPRSGTKLLRDLLAQHPDVARVPYDINYVWLYGNQGVNDDDRLSPDLVTPKTQTFIREYLKSWSNGESLLIEKTVGNCVRVPFVQRILPEARFIHIVRDGRDVVESIRRKWLESPDWRYIAQKALKFPLRSAVGYAVSYAAKLLRQAFGGSAKDDIWGVRYPGFAEDVQEMNILQVAARQWVACVEYALKDLKHVPGDSQLEVRYEELVTDPINTIDALASFLGVSEGPLKASSFMENISAANIGKGFRFLDEVQQDQVLDIIRPKLIELDYLQT